MSLAAAADDPAARREPAEFHIQVHVAPRLIKTGGAVRARIRTARHEQNRGLRVVLDAPSYYARSDFELPGADSAVLRGVVFDGLPDGVYALIATVHRADGSQQRAASCFVVGFGSAESMASGTGRRSLDASNAPLPTCP